MHVVVVGATGNVGTAVLRALRSESAVRSVLGVARRPPAQPQDPGDKVRWHAADISRDSLEFVAGADAVVHLAWLIQPSRDEDSMRATNVDGTRRLVEAVIAHRVPGLVYASSVGTYSPAPKDVPLDESWPTTGVPSSTYSRHKAEVEALLDVVEGDHPQLRLVRLRTSLVFQRAAASEVHRLFLGRLMPWHLPRPLRIVPGVGRLVFQATHADDIAAAYVRAVTGDVSGAFNVAAEPPLTPRLIAEAVGGRVLPTPESLLRLAVGAAYRVRLVPTEAGWLDMATNTPLMDTSRARRELAWNETHSSIEALTELLDAIGEGAGGETPALAPRRRWRHASAPIC
jgi:UDP-glucose 4-epimerase